MLKRQSFYIVSLFCLAVVMTAGCATHEDVKKDEGVVPASVATAGDQSKPSPQPTTQAATPPVSHVTPSSTPAGQQVQNASSAAQLQAALEKIYFDFDSANLSESARNALTKNAAALSKESSATIRIEGNCDERGSAEYNLALGERRAKAAQQYLASLGVASGRLSIISYGKEKPAVKGSDEAAMAKNRRDEFVVLVK